MPPSGAVFYCHEKEGETMSVDILELEREMYELRDEAKSLLDKEDRTAEDVEKAKPLIDRAEKLAEEIELRKSISGWEEPKHVDPETPGKKPETKGFDNFGEFLRSVYLSSGGRYMDERLAVVPMEDRAASGLNESAPAAGGFLVQEDFAQELWKRTYETGVLASKCKRVPISSNANRLKMNYVDETSRATGSRWGGIQVYRDNEADLYTASKPKFGQINLALEKMTGLCYATDELLEDTAALNSIIGDAFAEEFGFALDNEIIRGTGAGQCLGILNADCLVSVAIETNQAADTILTDNIVKMYSRMYAKSRPRAEWYINQDCEPQLFTMSLAVGTGGIPVYMPANGLSGSPYGTLLGRPVVPLEQCDTVGDKGDILFMDLSQYLLIEKGGVDAASSIHVRFLYGENTFRFTVRNNGQPIWHSALTPFQSTNTLSPFISLDARA